MNEFPFLCVVLASHSLSLSSLLALLPFTFFFLCSFFFMCHLLRLYYFSLLFICSSSSFFILFSFSILFLSYFSPFSFSNFFRYYLIPFFSLFLLVCNGFLSLFSIFFFFFFFFFFLPVALFYFPFCGFISIIALENNFNTECSLYRLSCRMCDIKTPKC